MSHRSLCTPFSVYRVCMPDVVLLAELYKPSLHLELAAPHAHDQGRFMVEIQERKGPNMRAGSFFSLKEGSLKPIHLSFCELPHSCCHMRTSAPVAAIMRSAHHIWTEMTERRETKTRHCLLGKLLQRRSPSVRCWLGLVINVVSWGVTLAISVDLPYLWI